VSKPPPPNAQQILTYLTSRDPWSSGWIVAELWAALTPRQRQDVWNRTEEVRTRDIDGNPRDAAALLAAAEESLEQWRRERERDSAQATKPEPDAG
jgi:hypothetical protein